MSTINLHFNSGVILDEETRAAAGDELEVEAALAHELIAAGIAYSLDPAPARQMDRSVAEWVDTDGTMDADSDEKIPSQKAVRTLVAASIGAPLDTDGTMAANTDAKAPSQKAVRTYVGANFTKAPVAAPSAANSAGVAGTWAYDATHLYVCVNMNTWVRTSLATWP